MELKHEELWPLVRDRLKVYMGKTWDHERIASVTGSTPSTVAGWLTESEPNGERLIRLWHFLAASGLDSPEIKQLGDFNRYCGELLVFGFVTMDELCQICGVKSPNAVLRALRGTPPVRPKLSYWELQDLYDTELRAAKAVVSIIAIDDTPAQSERVSTANSEPVAAVVSEIDMTVLVQAASVFGAALPFARYLNSDAVSPEMRSEFRRLMGDDGMFTLSTLFNSLCSERSRKQGRLNR